MFVPNKVFFSHARSPFFFFPSLSITGLMVKRAVVVDHEAGARLANILLAAAAKSNTYGDDDGA